LWDCDKVVVCCPNVGDLVSGGLRRGVLTVIVERYCTKTLPGIGKQLAEGLGEAIGIVVADVGWDERTVCKA
jgi:hypothetical protein